MCCILKLSHPVKAVGGCHYKTTLVREGGDLKIIRQKVVFRYSDTKRYNSIRWPKLLRVLA